MEVVDIHYSNRPLKIIGRSAQHHQYCKWIRCIDYENGAVDESNGNRRCIRCHAQISLQSWVLTNTRLLDIHGTSNKKLQEMTIHNTLQLLILHTCYEMKLPD